MRSIMKTIKLIILLLSCCLVSGCLDRYLHYDTEVDFVLINEIDKKLVFNDYFVSKQGEEVKIYTWESGPNDTITMYSSSCNSQVITEDEIFRNAILGKYKIRTRIVFRDEAGNVVKEWYAKDADSEPGNFFNRDSWEYKKSPNYEPYVYRKAIVWTFRIKENPE